MARRTYVGIPLDTEHDTVGTVTIPVYGGRTGIEGVPHAPTRARATSTSRVKRALPFPLVPSVCENSSPAADSIPPPRGPRALHTSSQRWALGGSGPQFQHKTNPAFGSQRCPPGLVLTDFARRDCSCSQTARYPARERTAQFCASSGAQRTLARRQRVPSAIRAPRHAWFGAIF